MAAKRGRKSTFNKAVFEKICSKIEEGKSQRQACKETKTDESTFRTWLRSDDLKGPINTRYAHAREQQIRGIGDRLRDRPKDFLDYYFDEGGNKRLDPATVQLARLAVDTDKFLLARLLPKVYGDNPELEKVEIEQRPHEAVNRNIISEPAPKRYEVE